MDNQQDSSQIAERLIIEIGFQEEDKRHLLDKFSTLIEEEKKLYIAKLEEVKRWREQVKIDDAIFNFEHEYPKLLEKAKSEILNYFQQEKKAADDVKADEILQKLKHIQSETTEDNNQENP